MESVFLDRKNCRDAIFQLIVYKRGINRYKENPLLPIDDILEASVMYYLF